ncbi:hypothetical protein TEA_023338 [Camellia sinensis var. sinensis]|uniref:Uncharacterized protein n=2 Tax=Camellia sinensis TaxID=4442 RepID=A0A4S4DX31_CAMSN|nr:hypothetical protein TEA_023338 [Camellia sinensis var. sinensis]
MNHLRRFFELEANIQEFRTLYNIPDDIIVHLPINDDDIIEGSKELIPLPLINIVKRGDSHGSNHLELFFRSKLRSVKRQLVQMLPDCSNVVNDIVVIVEDNWEFPPGVDRNRSIPKLQRSFPIQTSGHIEEPVAEEEQPQTESSDSKTAASDNMLPKNFLELIAIQKSQKESKLAPAPLAASSLTTSERLQCGRRANLILFLILDVVFSSITISEVAAVRSPIILIPSPKYWPLTSFDMTMGGVEMATAIAPDKLKLTKDKHDEKANELELRLATSKGKVVEMEKRLQIVDTELKSSAQEVSALKEKKQQLFATLDASRLGHNVVVKVAKEGGYN